ncbi:MAG: hypothetical protein KAV82_09795 [Phycisphaerae bacterium]|nr:hypothetical protein [Phycisphaerae bacterium]
MILNDVEQVRRSHSEEVVVQELGRHPRLLRQLLESVAVASIRFLQRRFETRSPFSITHRRDGERLAIGGQLERSSGKS